jgi:hypothetical protein
MTPEEFVIWLRGFAEAANPYNITPKQWESLKQKLDSVEIEEFEGEYEVTDYGEVVTYNASTDDSWYVNHTSGSFDIRYYNRT